MKARVHVRLNFKARVHVRSNLKARVHARSNLKAREHVTSNLKDRVRVYGQILKLSGTVCVCQLRRTFPKDSDQFIVAQFH